MLFGHAFCCSHAQNLICFPFQTSPFSGWFVSKHNLSSSPPYSQITAQVVLIFLLQVLSSDTRSPALFSESPLLTSSTLVSRLFNTPAFISLSVWLSIDTALGQGSACFPGLLLPHQFICVYFCTACSQNFFGVPFLFLLIPFFFPPSQSQLSPAPNLSCCP